MTHLLVALGLLALVVLLHLARVALVSARPNGRFDVVADTPEQFSFRSDYGEFVVDHGSATLRWTKAQATQVVPLSDAIGLEYRAAETDAPGSDLLLGMGLMDFSRPFRDSVEWHELVLVGRDRSRLALFRSGRLRRRQWLGFAELEDALLRQLGLVQDVEGRTREVRAMLQARLGKSLIGAASA